MTRLERVGSLSHLLAPLGSVVGGQARADALCLAQRVLKGRYLALFRCGALVCEGNPGP